MPYSIRTYEGKDDWGNKKFLAHMNLGNDIYMSFFGVSVVEAEAKARNWYDNEQKRYKNIDVSEAEEATPDTGGWGNFKASQSPSGDHGMVGKVWMIHHAEKKRARVAPSEVDTYIGMGYVNGGPKTKFMD